MLPEFTRKVNEVMVAAAEEAQALHHDHVGPEHVLLGLLAVKDCMGSALIKSYPIDLPTLIDEIKARPRQGKVRTPIEAMNIPFAPTAQECLTLAVEEANRMAVEHVGTEHVLLGVFRVLAGPLSEISGTKTLRLSDVREKALALARDKNNKEKENRAASEFPSSSVSLSDEFSPNGEFIVLAANKNVRELREPFVTPVDFLTELMRVPGGCRGMMILERLGLEREVILSKLKEEVNSRPLECPYCQHPMKNWPKEWFSDTIAGWYGPVLSQDAQRVLNFAHQEAKHAAKSRIGSEHILLGLMLSGDRAAAKTLEALGITVSSVQKEIGKDG